MGYGRIAAIALCLALQDEAATRIVVADANGVEEPASLALMVAGVRHDITAFIRRISVPPEVFHVRDEWIYRGSDGAESAGQFGIPAAYTESSDPVLAAGNGRTVYAVGRVMNRDPLTSASANPASIRLWQSADGGFSWPGSGIEVDAEPAASARTVDKPWIAVSPDGTVYVAWVRVVLGGSGGSQIMLRRSRNASVRGRICCGRSPGWTWDPSVAVSLPGDVTGPQIVFDDRGYVYVIWTDFGNRELRMARSLHPGGTFDPAAAQTVAGFRRINFGAAAYSIAGGIRVLPLASAQFDAVTREIIVAWSDGETDLGPLTDLRIVRGAVPATDGPMSFAPMNLSSINEAGSDQFTPAIAIANSGNAVMAWYDRSGTTDTDYRERVAELTPTGAIVAQTIQGDACQSAIVGEYQWLSRSPDSAGGLWQMAWACSSAEDRAIWQTGEPLGH